VTVGCILVAAGIGERLGAGRPKALVEVGGRALVRYAVEAVAASGVVDHLTVVAPPGHERQTAGIAAAASSLAATSATGAADARPRENGLLRESGRPQGTSVCVVTGGATRQQSVRNGLDATPADADVVLVHDAARCFAPPTLIAQIVAAVRAGADAVVPAVPVVDTLVEVDEPGATVVGAPDRRRLRAVQTPQGFRRQVLEDAHVAAAERGDRDATDDAGLVRRLGVEVHAVPGVDEAFKITTPLDLARAEAALAAGLLR